ncbi:MAG: hypothetical protein ACHP7K_09165 [Actinomycetales bacterium]
MGEERGLRSSASRCRKRGGSAEHRTGGVERHRRCGERLIVPKSDETADPRNRVFGADESLHVPWRRIAAVEDFPEKCRLLLADGFAYPPPGRERPGRAGISTQAQEGNGAHGCLFVP